MTAHDRPGRTLPPWWRRARWQPSTRSRRQCSVSSPASSSSSDSRCRLARQPPRLSRSSGESPPYGPATGVSDQPISGFGAVKNCEEMCLGPERVGEWPQVELLGPVKRCCRERWKQACTVCPLHRHHAGSDPHHRARSRPRTERVRFGMRSSALANCAAASPPRPCASRKSPYIS